MHIITITVCNFLIHLGCLSRIGTKGSLYKIGMKELTYAKFMLTNTTSETCKECFDKDSIDSRAGSSGSSGGAGSAGSARGARVVGVARAVVAAGAAGAAVAARAAEQWTSRISGGVSAVEERDRRE